MNPEEEGALASARAEVEKLYRLLVDQQRFDHAILDGVDVGIVTTDIAGRVTFVNRTARLLLRTEETVGGDVRDLLSLVQTAEEILAGDDRRVITHNVHRLDGDELELELSLSRGAGSGDVRVGFSFMFRDVAEQRREQEERRRFERLVAMGTMVAGFAHEVRNPVAALRSICEELVEVTSAAGEPLPHPARMLKVLERIERLVRASLALGRPTTPRRATHRPWTILSSAIMEMGPRTREATMSVDIEPELPDLYVDDGQIVQVLVALMNNAIDAVGTPRRVRLRALRTAGAERDTWRSEIANARMGSCNVRFEVIDDGAGIPASRLGRVFDPFFTTKPSGTGLGLSIAQQIANENGGRIQVTSVPGYTVFAIVLPGVDPALSRLYLLAQRRVAVMP